MSCPKFLAFLRIRLLRRPLAGSLASEDRELVVADRYRRERSDGLWVRRELFFDECACIEVDCK